MIEEMATITVRVSTRELIVRAAMTRGQTIDEYLTHLQQEHAWREQMTAARSAMADPDAEYLAETATWDALEAW